MAKTLEQQARELYEACPTPKPAWDQLGPQTKSVWLEYVTNPKPHATKEQS